MKKQYDQRVLRRAAAVGRLMLGEFGDWDDFREVTSGKSAPRRVRRAEASIDRRSLAPEIDKFVKENFDGMTIEKLSNLYDEIEPPYGLRIDNDEFERRFAHIKPGACSAPKHATLQISLWGLQFECPEDHLSKDIQCALNVLRKHSTAISGYVNYDTSRAKKSKDTIGSHIRMQNFAARSCVLCCFSLLECYLNCLAWDYTRKPELIADLDDKKTKKLTDRGVNFEEKLRCYPKWLLGLEIKDFVAEEMEYILSIVKPFRDSIVHPSPFARPEEFGGKPKLQRLYSVGYDEAKRAAQAVFAIIRLCHSKASAGDQPQWLTDLNRCIVSA